MAVVQGRALAGGAGLVTACDLAVAGAGAQLGYPEIQRGFVPAMVMTLLRRAVGEKVALDLVLTGRVLAATEARAAGLLARVVPDAALEREAGTLIASLADASPSALALTKQLFYQLDGRRWRTVSRSARGSTRSRARRRISARPSPSSSSGEAGRLGLGARGLALAGFAVASWSPSRFEDQRLGWAAIALLRGSLLIVRIRQRSRQGCDACHMVRVLPSATLSSAATAGRLGRIGLHVGSGGRLQLRARRRV